MISISEENIDDLMREVFQALLKDGREVEATRGENRELVGAVLELRNPRARLSRSQTRGKAYSCLGELCWYLSGSDSGEFIRYYLPAYDSLSSAYGPRLGPFSGPGQFESLAKLLASKPSTRRAVAQIFNAADLNGSASPPCTCSLQFIARDGRLSMYTHMRSNDAYLGLPHDVFCFTMIQELLACQLDLEVGRYWHAAVSLHLYKKHEEKARAFLDEGWQQTTKPMPPMPKGDPLPSLDRLLRAERLIRCGQEGQELLSDSFMQALDPYWSDLIRILVAFQCFKVKDANGLESIMGELKSSSVYRFFLEERLVALRSREMQQAIEV